MNLGPHNRRRCAKAGWIGAGFALAVLLGLLDYATGPRISLSVFYLVPVALAAWRVGRGGAVLAACFCAGARLAADWLATAPPDVFINSWNAAIRLGFFLIVGLLLSMLRASHRGLRNTVQSRTAALEAEIAERRRAEESLRQSEARLHAIASGAQDAILMMDDEGKICFWNPAAEKILGYSKQEAHGKVLHDLLAPARFLEAHKTKFPHFRRSGEGAAIGKALELAALRKDGTEIPIELSLSAVRLGERWHAVGIIRDITERLRLQEQFNQAQKMEAVGQLAGGVAHDFNNILTGITGYAQLAEELGPEETETRAECLGEIRGLADRAAALTRQLLAFGRRQAIEPVVLDLNAVVENTSNLLRQLISEHIELELQLGEGLGAVRADPSQIEQVLANLVVNARDAMPAGGSLTIGTANLAPTAGDGDGRPSDLASGHCVLLTVADTGCGMDPAVRARVFEPFFTTKGPGKGTGLGLPTVYGIVHQHGGHIAVCSEPGAGATFRIYLPRVFEPLASPQAELPAQPVRRGHETIILVEDEPSVRSLVRRVLERRGYRVLAAEGPDQAEDLFARHGADVALLLTDVVMPRRTGVQLYEKLRLECPELKVLYMSGYAPDVIARSGFLGQETQFIQKPFEPAALAERVRRVLDRPADRADRGDPRTGHAERSALR